jgi:heat-inducible transcriptional repressor
MELDNRGREILREIIRNFIHSGEPVGSRTISKIHPEGLSAASIRNIMADLEEMGYLMQPHTSAGRVPTDRGYRYYVDSLLTGMEVPRSDRERVAEAVRGQGGLPEVLVEISRVISSITHQVGFVVSPDHTLAVLKHIEFISLGSKRILAILVDRSESSTIAPIHPRRFRRKSWTRSVNTWFQYHGKTLTEIRGAPWRMKEKGAIRHPPLPGSRLGTQFLRPGGGGSTVFVQGASNILQQPDISDMDEMRRIFETFEAKGKLVKILDEVVGSEGLRVVIGSEHSDPALAHLALVVSPYKVGDQPAGMLGVLGPTRMEYARAIALVGYISKLLSRILTVPSS